MAGGIRMPITGKKNTGARTKMLPLWEKIVKWFGYKLQVG
jgi:hypothetical protein